MYKIGITVDLMKSIWSNGINQNAIYLANVLNKIGFDAYLIYQRNEGYDKVEDINGIKVMDFKEAFNIEFDLLIQLGISINSKTFENFRIKNKNIKLVFYKCGNDFVIDMEAIFLDSHKERTESLESPGILNNLIPDQIWTIPQNENANIQYFSFIHKQPNATSVPFIWDPMAINSECDELGYSSYSPRKISRLAIMEPNIGVTKNVLLPIAITEKSFRESADINKIYLIGGIKLKSNKRLLQILKNTEIYKNGLITAEPRIPTMDVINKHSDIVLSWQWENNLNYLWLDIAWMGWPIVHNGSFCKDIGYYYEGFNIIDGSNKLKYAFENHNGNLEYLEKNREVIKKYTAENPSLLLEYKELVENVISGKFKKYEYSPERNSIK